MADINVLGNIPYGILMQLHDIYKRKKIPRLEAGTGSPGSDHPDKDKETRSVHFTLREMDASGNLQNTDFLNFLLNVVADTTLDGVRIYLCAYDKTEIQHGTTKIPSKPEYLKKLTIGFVTTKINSTTGKYEDYYPTEKYVAPPLNHGTLCPPDDCP